MENQVATWKGKAQTQRRLWVGRQIAWIIYKNFRTSGENEAILDFGELLKVELNNDNMQPFDNRWDEVLPGMTGRLGENILGRQDRLQLNNSDEL